MEDNDADVLITRRTILKLVESPQIEVVEDLTSFKDKLIGFVPDVVISDYNLPTCTGLDILQLVQEKNPELPVIFLTGTIRNEEVAADTVLAGAWAYILKKNMHNLEEKLRPLLKKVVFRMDTKDEVRDRLRQNKIAVNQIYDYLDNLKSDNREQKKSMREIKKSLRDFEIRKDDDKET